MDEYDRGMDPEVKRYFVKIVNSFSAGLVWLLTVVTAGLFFHLGLVENGWHWQNVVFYALSVFSFVLLLRYFYRLWR